MNSLQFKENEFKKFCATIGFSPLIVNKLSSSIGQFYDEWIEEKIDKNTGDLKKYQDGTIKKRIIRPSLNQLKEIQKNIKNKILSKIAIPKYVHGGVKGLSNITNAKTHQGNKYQFTTDLQDFYPSISSQMVYDTFIKLKFSPHFSHWLTIFTTWKYQLPQGSPTSAHIANLVFLETDYQLQDFCKKHDIKYTRYVDDLTFSSQKNFKPILTEIINIITNNGFKLSYRKTKYCGYQSITGIDTFLNKIDAPKKIIDKANMEEVEKSVLMPYTNYIKNIRKTNKAKKLNKF
jgi:RNA-directed DNA polymerase